MSDVYFLKIFKSILLSPFEKLHNSLFYLSILFLTFLSSTTFQMYLRPSLHFFLRSMFLIHTEQHSKYCFYKFRFHCDWLRAGRSGIETRLRRDFPPVQTGPGAHPASCRTGTGSFPGVEYGRGVLLTTHPLLVPRSWKSTAIPLPTLWATPGL